MANEHRKPDGTVPVAPLPITLDTPAAVADAARALVPMLSDPQLTLVSTTDPLSAVQAALGVTPTPEEPSPEVTDAQPAPPTPPTETEPADRQRRKDGIQARIDELVKQRDHARGTSAAQEAELQALRARVTELAGGETAARARVPVERADTEPKVEDYPDYDSYVAALTRHHAAAASDAAVAAERRRAESERSTMALLQIHGARVADAKTRYDDFDEVVSRPEMMISTVVRDGIVVSEHGPDIAYYLATHPEEREQLLALGDTPKALVAFGKLEAKVESHIESLSRGSAPRPAPAPRITRAPDPIDPVRGVQVTTTVRPDQMSYQEYKRWRERGSR